MLVYSLNNRTLTELAYMQSLLTTAQFILPVLLITVILLQARGTGLGAGFGGEGNIQQTKRGVEKKIHNTTIVISILFFISAFLDIYLQL